MLGFQFALCFCVHGTWLRSPRRCSPLDTLIIAHIRLFVKYFFFAKSYILPRRYLARTSSKEDGRESPSPSRLEVISPTFRTFFHSHLFCTLIVSQLGRFVKSFFVGLGRIFYPKLTFAAAPSVWVIPLLAEDYLSLLTPIV